MFTLQRKLFRPVSKSQQANHTNSLHIQHDRPSAAKNALTLQRRCLSAPARFAGQLINGFIMPTLSNNPKQKTVVVFV